MEKLLLGLVLGLLFFQSCDKAEPPYIPPPEEEGIPTCEDCNFTCFDTDEPNVITDDCIDNWTCSFLATPQSMVDLEEHEGRSAGTKNVFQMINWTEGSPAIADDEFQHVLVFELDESQTSFSAEGDQFEEMKVHFKRVCFCADGVQFMPLTEGCLQGEKQAEGNWFIQGHLPISYSWGEMEVKFEAQFSN